MERVESILRELYNGNINPNRNIPNTDEYNEKIKELNIISDKIIEKLPQQDRGLVDEYIEKQSQISSLDCENQFIYGYKLAIKLIMGAL